ncbi:P protein isoform X2 [Lutzomyia longipalpis]|uniref:P protein isoform X2 n=1 Tax=Lutzomyia longipalpis TaxID=7200 RepID=UPI0024846E42|nr:P protein isoform X2 [Lutzomyia longipalpis]XP_055682906.1 P protein isoform X2 [Lutzomyia longipalpis]XP_055682907.1 P protein isoform X2 [Lutzomyia longipalpis]XP_055682908.1 P protein isoform X2 [Lutzomyia longipalpis]
MKVKATGKRIFRRKKSKRNSEEIVKPNEVTEGALQVWRALPEKIRQDPSLASFRQEHERLHGGLPCDEDPLPNEDVSANGSTNEVPISNEFVQISVTNEHGQMKNISGAKDDHEMTDVDDTDAMTGHRKQNKWVKNIKIGILLMVWILFTGILMSTTEKVLEFRQLAVPEGQLKSYTLSEAPKGSRVGINLQGAFLPVHYSNLTENRLSVFIYLQNATAAVDNDNSSSQVQDLSYYENVTEAWHLTLVQVDMIDSVPELVQRHNFDLSQVVLNKVRSGSAVLQVRMFTNINASLPLQFAYDPSPINKNAGIIYAAIVLLGLYIMIIWEVVHRTFAAMIASTLSIAVLAALDERPTMPELMSWIDVETLLLLFGMMILVAILSETGIFDYLAVYAYKITNGKVWPLINCLCLFTAVMSSFLDNVTTVLLMTPVTIRLCEVMELNPVPILMSMIIYSNIGGALTPVGDPPNVIIASNSHIAKAGVNFTTFTLHMTIGVILVMIQTYFQLRFKFKNINDLRFTEPQDVQELRHEIAVWQRAAASLSSYSKDEDLVRETLLKKVNRLSRMLKKKLVTGSVPIESYKTTLEELQAKYPIRNRVLLVKSGVTLVFVVAFFFLHSVPELQRLSLGWTALLGAILLLILADREDMESVLARVEFSTLLFFACLFVLMESLAKLGLIDWIGKQTENIILSVSEESRLAVALLLILWVSAIASAFVDNIPLTTMMVKIAISLAENEALDLPLQPLVWALAFGACLGGNGTLIGASANVVCAGVAEQHGYRFTFVEYFKVGFPVMIGSIVVATGYLMVAHVLFTWH